MSVVFYAIVARSGWQMQVGEEKRSGDVFVLGEAVAYVGGDALLNDVAEEARERGCDGDQKPEERRDCDTADCDSFERDGDDVGLVEMQAYGADVGHDFKPVNDDGGEQEGSDGERADGDEKNVDGACHLLTATAVCAVGQVLVVVLAHCWGEARDVVTPAGEDVADNLIDAGCMVCGDWRGMLTLLCSLFYVTSFYLAWIAEGRRKIHQTVTFDVLRLRVEPR